MFKLENTEKIIYFQISLSGFHFLEARFAYKYAFKFSGKGFLEFNTLEHHAYITYVFLNTFSSGNNLRCYCMHLLCGLYSNSP